jgi:uncharacterized protein YcbX
MRLASIHVYPLKGARGIALDRADVLLGGLRHDRRFMLVSTSGDFFTQRNHPRLALVTTTLHPTSLVIGVPGAEVELALAPDGPRRSVRIWNDHTEAVEVPGEAGALLSSYLGERCVLVFMPDDVTRPVNPRYAVAGDRVGFADGYPLLLATQASLDDLNARLDAPVPMNRFRPNLVVEGGAAYEEERHDHVTVGSLVFRMPKGCDRCSVTTVDQATAVMGKEPLRTLASYRTRSNKVYFAQNLIPNAEGVLTVGDEVRYSGIKVS